MQSNIQFWLQAKLHQPNLTAGIEGVGVKVRKKRKIKQGYLLRTIKPARTGMMRSTRWQPCAHLIWWWNEWVTPPDGGPEPADAPLPARIMTHSSRIANWKAMRWEFTQRTLKLLLWPTGFRFRSVKVFLCFPVKWFPSLLWAYMLAKAVLFPPLQCIFGPHAASHEVNSHQRILSLLWYCACLSIVTMINHLFQYAFMMFYNFSPLESVTYVLQGHI